MKWYRKQHFLVLQQIGLINVSVFNYKIEHYEKIIIIYGNGRSDFSHQLP